MIIGIWVLYNKKVKNVLYRFRILQIKYIIRSKSHNRAVDKQGTSHKITFSTNMKNCFFVALEKTATQGDSSSAFRASSIEQFPVLTKLANTHPMHFMSGLLTSYTSKKQFKVSLLDL